MTSRPVNKPLTFVAGMVGVIVTGLVDYATGYEVRLFPLYFLPVAYVAWHRSRTAAVAMSVMSSVAWALANWLAGRGYASPLTWPVNIVSQFVAFATIGILVSELRRRLVAEEGTSRQDPLTSLPNSRAFYERGGLLLAIARRSTRPLTLAYLDLDNFKKVNDERGHQEGDRALAETAEVLRSHVRASDLVARLGGDEFAILLSDTGPDAARTSLERVRDLVADAMRRNDWPVTVSVGAVSYVRAPLTLEEAIKEADSIMYRAKENGKNRLHIEVADPDVRFAPVEDCGSDRAP